MKSYIVWVDYGTEGWQPNYFTTEEEVIAYIKSGISMPFIVTKLLNIRLWG